MKAKAFAIFILGLMFVSACGKDTTLKAEQLAPGSQVWIDAPLPGSRLPLASLEIVAHASSPDGITSFEISLNGQPLAKTSPDPSSIDQTMMYTRHTWRPAAPGSYLVEVKAFDRSNKPSPPAQVMVIIAAGESATPSATLTSSPAVPSTLTLTPTPQATGTITPTSLPCDLASFGGDITVPDGTEFAPGQTFKKTWRVKNIGSCTWTTTYNIVFVGGDSMDAPASFNLGHDVPPGQYIDITVPMRASELPGSYHGYWKLRNTLGKTFSFATGSALSVEIEVVAAPTATNPPRKGCIVRSSSGTVCKVPCPPGAKPGLPCTP